MQRTAPRSDASPPRNCSHEALPFVEAPAKAKLAGSIETQPGRRLAALTAFCILHVPIMTARNKDVRRERVVLCFHCRKLGFDITYRKLDEFKKQAELDAAALNLADRQLNPGRDLPAVTPEELDSAIALASPPVKTLVFNRGWQLRSESWRDPKTKPKVELAIPLFRALIRSDTQNAYHRNHAQLGYSLKDKPQPDWADAEKELTTAIEIRGPVAGTRLAVL